MDNNVINQRKVVVESIKGAITSTSERYKNSLESAFPAFKNRLQERNLTFNFAYYYLKSHEEAIVWQEVPIEKNGKKSQHIDTVIIDKERNAVIFVEAKCISRTKVTSRRQSMFKDLKRLNEVVSDISKNKKKEDAVLPINKDLAKVCEGKDKYFLILADVWSTGNDNRKPEEWGESQDEIFDKMPSNHNEFKFVVTNTDFKHKDIETGTEESHYIVYALYRYQEQSIGGDDYSKQSA